MEKIAEKRRKRVVKRVPFDPKGCGPKLDHPRKINGATNGGNLNLTVQAENTNLWTPPTNSDRDALATLIPHSIPPVQKNGDRPSMSARTGEFDGTPAKLTETLADTSVVHAIPGRVRLRVPALKTSPGLVEPLQRLLRDQPGVVEVTVNDWCYSVTVICDPSKWTSDRLCLWVQLLSPAEVLSYKSANESSIDQAQAPTDEAGNELWYSSAGICLVLLVE